jgi:hypothetical protein
LKVRQEGLHPHDKEDIVVKLWGENSPEEWFLTFLYKLFQEKSIKAIKEECPEVYVSMLQDFEDWKGRMVNKDRIASEDGVASDKTSLEISILPAFEKKVTDITSTKLGTLIQREEFEGKVKLKTDRILSVNNDLATKCFLKLTEQTKKLAEERILKRSDIKCVCMTGMYSNVPSVREAMKQCFPTQTVVIPSNPELVVAKGAAYYGYKLYLPLIAQRSK